jgi:integrase
MLTNDGLKENTVRHARWKLQELARNTDIFNPESVKHYIATAISKKTGKPFSDETRNKFAYAVDKFYEKHAIEWKKPFYNVAETIPIIPSKQSVTLIISNASDKYVTIFTLLAEIGCDGMELSNVTQADIDKEQAIISIRGCKGHASGTYKLKPQTAEMLRIYLHEHTQEHPFPKSTVMGQVWRDTRERTAKKLCKPDLNKIPLKSLRNYSGAQLYLNLPVRDPIAVMRHLRHKKLETTMHYIRGIALTSDEDASYMCRATDDKNEIMKLIEDGYTKVDEINGLHLYRKRK